MHRTKLLNITGFAAGAAANTPLTVLSFSRTEFLDYRAAIPALVETAVAFPTMQGEYVAVRTTDQRARLLECLANGGFRMDPFLPESSPGAILGLSFGESPD